MLRIKLICGAICIACIHLTAITPTEKAFNAMCIAQDSKQRARVIEDYVEQLRMRYNYHRRDSRIIITSELPEKMVMWTYTNLDEQRENMLMDSPVAYPETVIFCNRAWLHDKIFTPIVLTEINSGVHGFARQSVNLKRKHAIYPTAEASITNNTLRSRIYNMMYEKIEDGSPLNYPIDTSTLIHHATSYNNLDPHTVDATISMARKTDAKRLMARWIDTGCLHGKETPESLRNFHLRNLLQSYADAEPFQEETVYALFNPQHIIN